jgi:hypothetical protein
MNSETASNSRTRFVPLAAAGLLFFMAVLAWGAARRESVVFDEMAHTAAGLSYLQKLDMRFNEEHPPLAKVIAAIPLALSRTRADYGGPVWTHSASFFSGLAGQWIFGSEVLMRWNDPRRTLLLARFPMLLLTLLLGWCIFRFSRRLGGDAAGLLCLGVYASTPLFLGLGPLVMTDAALTLFALLATWTFANLWQDTNLRNVLNFSLALAAAILSKFSSGLLFFAIAAFIVISWRFPFSKSEDRSLRRARILAVIRGIGLAACWVYLFCLILSWNQAVDIPSIGSAAFGRLLMPAWIYIRGMVLFVVMATGGSYILGHDYSKGIWFYFPVLLVLKSAPGFIGLLIVSLIARTQKARAAAGDRSLMQVHWRMLWVTAAVFGGLCILSHYNRDFRHFSFPVALLIVLLAALPDRLRRLRRKSLARVLQVCAAILAVSCGITAIRAFPYYLSYISAFGMGRPAWTLVSGGNLDYGQSLYQVASFAETLGIKGIPVDTYSPVDVNSWIPGARMWNCQNASSAESGLWVAVSANNISHGHHCLWLLKYPHQEIGGQSMYMIHMPDRIPAPGAEGRPPAPSLHSVNFLGIEGDLHILYMELLDHPEKFPATIASLDQAARDVAWRKFARIKSMLRHGMNE